MKIGTRSLLFGVHQFLWHPITVARAWRKLYGRWPNWRESICIFVHDWGYWGKPNMDGLEGRNHPILGAQIAKKIFEWLDCIRGVKSHRPIIAFCLTLFHSRELSKQANEKASLLCWADKYCVLCEPRWFYYLRAKLSGELNEYKRNHEDATGKISDWQWVNYYRNRVKNYPEIRFIRSLSPSLLSSIRSWL